MEKAKSVGWKKGLQGLKKNKTGVGKNRLMVQKNGGGVKEKRFEGWTKTAVKGWKTQIPDATGLKKRRRGLEKIRVGSEERTAGLEKETPLGERSTNWAEGWKNKIWKEVSKYEGGAGGFF